MIRKNINDVPFYEFEVFQQFGDKVRGIVLTRETDIKNLQDVCRVIGRDVSPFSFFEQQNGTKVHVVKEIPSAPEFYENDARGDALVTRLTGVPLVIRIADCASILLYDPVQHAAANIHAGWKGLAKRVIRETIRELKEHFGSRPENLDENMVDLWSAVEGQLRECGVRSDNIENPRICTACNHEEFFSYRREPEQGRFGTLIMLK